MAPVCVGRDKKAAGDVESGIDQVDQGTAFPPQSAEKVQAV
tara:strand:+ start:134 stop:256 length:123 start_codon:yes stop_codon:yes gene_type:complete